MRILSNGAFQPETDHLGAVCRQVLYDVNYQVIAQIVCEDGAEPPSIGDTVTIVGEEFIVKSVTFIESNMAYQKMQLVAESSLKCSEAEINIGE